MLRSYVRSLVVRSCGMDTFCESVISYGNTTSCGNTTRGKCISLKEFSKLHKKYGAMPRVSMRVKIPMKLQYN